MKNKFNIYGIYLPIFLLILPITVTLGTVSAIKYLEPTGHYSNNLLTNISAGILLVATIFFLSYIFIAREKMQFIPSFSSPLNYGPCSIVSVALIFVCAHLLIKSNILSNTLVTDTYTFVLALLALAAVVYFVMSSISVKRRSIRRSDYGLLVLIFICGYIAYIFFDTSTAINSPTKISSQMAFLSLALFFLYETRISLGREKWRPYVAFSFIAAIFTAYSSIPAIIAYFVNGNVTTASIYEAILTFAFFIFVIFRLFLVGELTPEKNSNVVKKLIAFADARIAELTPQEQESDPAAEPTVEDENQLSIADIEVEAELIDAPTVEEGFLIEQELPYTENNELIISTIQTEESSVFTEEKEDIQE